MGLILRKYIPEIVRLNQDNWAGTVIEQTSNSCCHEASVFQLNLQLLHIGVVANESDLTTYFDNYIMNPVLLKAMPGSSSPQNGGSNSRCAIMVMLCTSHAGWHCQYIYICAFTLIVLLQNKDNCCSWRGIPPLHDCLEYQA